MGSDNSIYYNLLMYTMLVFLLFFVNHCVYYTYFCYSSCKHKSHIF